MTMHQSISEDVRLGSNVRLADFINLYGCSVGNDTKIGAFVEIQKNSSIGNRCKISSHSFICEGVTVEDNVFIGHGVVFVNDTYPRSTRQDGCLQTEADWKVERTLIKKGASIGSGATILANVTVGENAIVGAGSVVTRDVPADTIVVGNPARVRRLLHSPVADEDLPIPFLDLIAPHRELEKELTDAFLNALHTAGFVGGPVVERFENSFATYCRAEHAVAVSSGTDALRFALVGSGVQPGDIVVTVPNTFIATTEAISQAGATPEFVDVDEMTSNMSASQLETYLSKQCRRDTNGRLLSMRSNRPVTAIIPVHLYGQVADMDAILGLAEEYSLMVIEDACQAHGAEYFSQKAQRWLRAGTMGCAAAFSFYPGKNLGACGEGGAITTNDPKIAAKCRTLRDHGQVKKYYHDVEGYNGRLDAIQAALLDVKLPYLDNWNEQRRARASEYRRLLSPIESLVLPHEQEWSRAVYHLYVVRSKDREGLMKHLSAAQIGTAIHYPIPLHLQKAYTQLGYTKGDFPVSEKLAAEIVSLPMFPQLSDEQQARVAATISAFISQGAMRIGENELARTEKSA